MKTNLVNGFGIGQGWSMQKYKGRIKQGRHPGSAAVKRKTLLNRAFIIYLAAALSLSAFAPMGEAQSQSDLGGCSAIVDGSRLSIIGIEAPNTIHVVGSERGIQVTCDGASDTFTGIEEMTMDGGGGDDRVTVDDSNGLLGGLAINVYSQGSADMILLLVVPLLPLFETLGIRFVGAPGPDVLQIAAGPLADRFDIASGPDPNSLAMEVTDIASGRQVADITGLKLEELTVQMGEGDDEANLSPLAGITTNIFGDRGNDTLHEVGTEAEEFSSPGSIWYGGDGYDVFSLIGTTSSENYEILPGAGPNSVEVHVTDIASGRQFANISGLELEELTVEMGDGDDQAQVFPSQGISINIHGQAGFDQATNELSSQDEFGPVENTFDGGTGYDKFSIVGTTASEDYEILPGAGPNSVEVRVTDIATETPLADISGSELEELVVETGDGDDQINTDNRNSLLGRIAISIYSQNGQDQFYAWTVDILPYIEQDDLFDLYGGPGIDTIQIIASLRPEHCDLTSENATSVEIRITDQDTGNVRGNIRVSEAEFLTVEMGEGDDQATVSLPPGITLNILGQGGGDQGNLLLYDLSGGSPPPPSGDFSFDGGPGENVLRIVSGPRDDQFIVRRGEAEDTVAVQVTDITTQTPVANILAAAVEETLIKMGAGNDILNKLGNVPTLLSAFGEEGDDTYSGVPFLESSEDIGSSESYLSGGTGYDKFTYKGTTAAEQYQMAGVPDLTIPDPELRVTDMLTGLLLAHAQFLDVEDVTVEAGDGNDRVEVNWDAALMSSLFIHADLGRGNDSFLANLLPVLTEPPTRDVQTARFEIDTGTGNDLVAFDHFAGSWFHVFFTAETGPGADTVNALLAPPPDDGIIGPEGLRLLQFNLVTGGNDDFVGLENQTGGESFNVFLDADLEGGSDTFVGRGGIDEATILGGRGVDTAHVTRNLLRFVSQFERIVILE